MHIKSIVVGAVFGLIAGVGSVSADEKDVGRTAVNTGTLFALPAGVATPMSEAELDAVRGQGPATEAALLLALVAAYQPPSSYEAGRTPSGWYLYFDGSAI